MDGIQTLKPLMPIIIFISFIFYLIIRKKKPVNIIKYSAISLFIIYVLFVIDAVFLPAPTSRFGIEVQRQAVGTLIRYNVIPFTTIWGVMKSGDFMGIATQIGGNIALFVPMPILLILMGKTPKSSLIWSISIVCVIELLQLALSLMYGFAYRSFDIDDILLNGTGVMVGYCFYRIAARIKHTMNVQNNT